MNEKIWQWHIENGEPVSVGEVTLTPQAQVFSLRLPFGGFVWNRPVAVVVEENGRSQRLPILDVTRMIMLAAVVVSTAVALMSRRK